jgi:DNA-binding PadR family transcriptional regulator
MAKISKTRYVILGLLSEKPLTGYDLKKIIELRFSLFWNESFGQIYPQLGRLEEEELVVRQPSASGKKRRNIYSITTKGSENLREWLLKPVETEISRYEILIKTYFGNLISQDNVKRFVEEFRRRHIKNLEVIEKFEAQLRDIRDLDENHGYVLMTVLFGKKVMSAFIEWSDDVLTVLKEIKMKKEKTIPF